MPQVGGRRTREVAHAATLDLRRVARRPTIRGFVGREGDGLRRGSDRIGGYALARGVERHGFLSQRVEGLRTEGRPHRGFARCPAPAGRGVHESRLERGRPRSDKSEPPAVAGG